MFLACERVCMIWRRRASSICMIMSLWLECCWHNSQPIRYICEWWSGFWIERPAFFHQLSPSSITILWYTRSQSVTYNSAFIQSSQWLDPWRKSDKKNMKQWQADVLNHLLQIWHRLTHSLFSSTISFSGKESDLCMRDGLIQTL
jgi:hypothetical protein